MVASFTHKKLLGKHSLAHLFVLHKDFTVANKVSDILRHAAPVVLLHTEAVSLGYPQLAVLRTRDMGLSDGFLHLGKFIID